MFEEVESCFSFSNGSVLSFDFLLRGVTLLLLDFTVATISKVWPDSSASSGLCAFGVMNGVKRDKEGKKAKREGVSVKMLSADEGRFNDWRAREGGYADASCILVMGVLILSVFESLLP